MRKPVNKERANPLEEKVRLALEHAGIDYTTPDGRRDPTGLDFRIVSSGVEIEVKRQHTERSARQLASAPNIILLQGPLAVDQFCRLLGYHGGEDD